MRKRLLSVAAIAAGAAMLVGCAGGGMPSPAPSPSATDQGTIAPSLVNVLGGIAVNSDGAAIAPEEANEEAVRVEIVFDLQCPWCAVAENGSKEAHDEVMNSGEAQFYYTPVSFLDRMSPDQYSSRAGSALVEVAETDPANFVSYMRVLLENQPSEGGASSHDSEALQKLAEEAGVSSEAVALIPEYRFQEFVLSNVQYVSQRTEVFPEGLSTPAVLIGGEVTTEANVLEGFTQVDFGDFSSPGVSFTQTIEEYINE